MKTCKKCGTQLIDEAVFCTNCGASLNEFEQGTDLLYHDDDELNTTVLDENIEESQPFAEEAYPVYEEPLEETKQGEVPPQYVNPAFNQQSVQHQYQQPPVQPQQNYYNHVQPQSSVNNSNGGYNAQVVTVEQPSLISCFKKFWQNYANFSGRARRSEYWYVILANFLLMNVPLIALTILGTILGIIIGNAQSIGQIIGMIFGVAMIIYSLASLVPSLALVIRRLHDIGKEWYFIFISCIPMVGSIILLVWMFQDSQPGANKFGPNPKGIN